MSWLSVLCASSENSYKRRENEIETISKRKLRLKFMHAVKRNGENFLRKMKIREKVESESIRTQLVDLQKTEREIIMNGIMSCLLLFFFRFVPIFWEYSRWHLPFVVQVFKEVVVGSCQDHLEEHF